METQPIAILDGSLKSVRELLSHAGFRCVDRGEELSAEDRECVEICVAPSNKDLKQYRNLRWVQLSSAGCNGYEAAELYHENGARVSLTTACGVYGKPISEYVLGALLCLTKRSLATHLLCHIGKCVGTALDAGNGNTYRKDISDMTVAIFGTGDIGSQVARLLRSLDCNRIIGINRSGKENDDFHEIYEFSKAEALLPILDVIVSTMPENEQSKNFFCKCRLQKCNGAYLINVGRGSAVVVEDLISCIHSGNIAGAALDVTSPDPLPRLSKARFVKGLLLTNHSSYDSAHNTDRFEALCCCQVECFLENRQLQNVQPLI